MTKAVYGHDLIQAFERWAPPSLALEGDRIGLQIGTLDKPIKKVLVTLDVLENVVEEAKEWGADLIFSHHAVIYRPLKNMRTDAGQSKIVAKCIKNDIAVYVAHTNLDVAEGGMNDWLADAIGIQDRTVLVPVKEEKLYKLAVYVPQSHADEVRTAIGKAGAGAIGRYTHCTFNVEGKGTFLPGEGTRPYLGKQGKLEIVDEVRIETIVPERLLDAVIRAMLDVHPYEEVAYDVYPLENKGVVHGLGRIGTLSEPMALKDLAEKVKARLDLDGVRLVGPLDARVRNVAVLGGAGKDFIRDAKRAGADVLITGDIDYHAGHDAMLEGLCLIDAGHTIEKVMKKGIAAFLKKYLQENGYDGTEVLASECDTNPFTFV